MSTPLAPGAPEGSLTEVLLEEPGAPPSGSEVAVPRESGPQPHRVALEDILPRAAPSPAAIPGMRTARVLRASGRKATISFRGGVQVEAAVAPEVDPGVVTDAVQSGDSVLVEVVEGEAPLVVGVLHTRRPRELKLKASTIHIEGEEEVLIRSGRGAVRVRADGDIEVVGSRISAASRGLFKIVGRILRLN